MTEQAKEFLTNCNATMQIEYAGLETPNWDNKPHNTYNCTITTPRGTMKVHFYDSAANTSLLQMSPKEYYEKCTKRNYKSAPPYEKNKHHKELRIKKSSAVPTEYDILACLIKYDVGSMDDFFAEFGFEIKCVEDMTNFINTYNAVVKEFNDIRRCFTEEQIEQLCEIY